ncbi:hypothetical protein BCR32DRAFT_295195 [Anaeromyces robustus]|uniref:VOC domain-containing protein n=1 Tax=Anaeromyces robustus TaxID=1754192 RepID=A0A1Y1WXN1_9FUNG|nr:hypothetical protein BCR32DRAFT_295195 [Anaeromyces robustus]|eukprot:ORX78145.1 hypothetical protein BCR32DRAFT_295195 [Anaeromyces robustus]
MNNYDNYFVPVDNLEEAKNYYENVLGLQKKFDFSERGMVAYKIGNEEPAIILKDKNKFKDMKPTVWFEVEDVNEMYKEMKTRNVNFLSEPFKILTGNAVEFEDPYGNRFGITDYKKTSQTNTTGNTTTSVKKD